MGLGAADELGEPQRCASIRSEPPSVAPQRLCRGSCGMTEHDPLHETRCHDWPSAVCSGCGSNLARSCPPLQPHSMPEIESPRRRAYGPIAPPSAPPIPLPSRPGKRLAAAQPAPASSPPRSHGCASSPGRVSRSPPHPSRYTPISQNKAAIQRMLNTTISTKVRRWKSSAVNIALASSTRSCHALRIFHFSVPSHVCCGL